MKISTHPIKLRSDQTPTVDQGKVGETFLSFNPDDGRFYLSRDPQGADVVTTYKDWRNAIARARRLAK